MKISLVRSLVTLIASSGAALGQADSFTNFIRQVQLPTNVVWDLSVASAGESLSQLAIDPGGARFELWTIQNDPLQVYLLDSKYVGTYVPMAEVVIRTEDPNTYTAIPRTRADRGFVVDVTVSGLRSGETDPEPSKSVKYLRHAQSYGVDGDGTAIDRDQASLVSQFSLVNNDVYRFTYNFGEFQIPADTGKKRRGEERFSVFSLEDNLAPDSQLASMFVQIWPVADGTISGIPENEPIRFKLPQLTLTLNDLYPDSQTYAHVYKGEENLGTVGTIISGSSKVCYGSKPENAVMVIDGWDAAITENGTWTMEILTVTPFDTQRLAYVTFDVNRTINVQGSFTTME